LHAKDSDGRKVWKGYYRFPAEVPLNLEDEYTQAFIVSGAKIFSKMLQVKTSQVDIVKVLESANSTIDFKRKKISGIFLDNSNSWHKGRRL